MIQKNTLITLAFFISLNIFSNQTDKLVVPTGFNIEIFADNLLSPRQITETKDGYIIVGSKNGDKIYALSDKDKDGFAEEKYIIASDLKNPTGVTYHDGDLYFSEIEDIWVIKNIDSWLQTNKKSIPNKESFIKNLPSETWHGFRHIRFGPDDKLYLPIGVPCNVCTEPQAKDERFAAIHKYENGELVMVADGVRTVSYTHLRAHET